MTLPDPANPLIVQGDHTVLVEVENPRYEACRDALARFAELVKSPEHIHTYRITPLSIWNACAAGVAPDEMVHILESYSKYLVPGHVAVEIRDFASRYGRLKIRRCETGLMLTTDDVALAREIGSQSSCRALPVRDGGADFLPGSAGRPRTPQAGIGQDRISRGGFGRVYPGGVAGDFPQNRNAGRSGIWVASLSTKGRGAVSSLGQRARRLWSDRVALRGRQDHRGHGLHGGSSSLHLDPGHQCHGGAAVDGRTAG